MDQIHSWSALPVLFPAFFMISLLSMACKLRTVVHLVHFIYDVMTWTKGRYVSILGSRALRCHRLL